MAPHLSGAELDLVTESVAKGMASDAILAAIAEGRKKAGVEPPQLQCHCGHATIVLKWYGMFLCDFLGAASFIDQLVGSQ